MLKLCKINLKFWPTHRMKRFLVAVGVHLFPLQFPQVCTITLSVRPFVGTSVHGLCVCFCSSFLQYFKYRKNCCYCLKKRKLNKNKILSVQFFFLSLCLSQKSACRQKQQRNKFNVKTNANQNCALSLVFVLFVSLVGWLAASSSHSSSVRPTVEYQYRSGTLYTLQTINHTTCLPLRQTVLPSLSQMPLLQAFQQENNLRSLYAIVRWRGVSEYSQTCCNM